MEYFIKNLVSSLEDLQRCIINACSVPSSQFNGFQVRKLVYSFIGLRDVLNFYLSRGFLVQDMNLVNRVNKILRFRPVPLYDSACADKSQIKFRDLGEELPF